MLRVSLLKFMPILTNDATLNGVFVALKSMKLLISLLTKPSSTSLFGKPSIYCSKSGS